MTEEKPKKPALLCLDVETNGLNIYKHRILEIACCVQDVLFSRPIADPAFFHRIVVPDYPGITDRGPAVDRALEDANDFVREMHEKNGLWNDMRTSLGRLPTQVDAELAVWLAKELQKGNFDKPLLCGASVHFDRKFFEREFPRTLELCSYRNFDVSTIKRAFEWWLDPADIPVPASDATKDIHRALPDIKWSIHEARVLHEKLDYLFRMQADS